ncbi:MAG: Phosphinothricin N-acetyltransferase [Candidatus Hydrogenedentota bacterium]|jgi:phosphinothricin acetyltransferase
MIRPVESTDAAPMAALYNHYVLHTTVTFEEEAVTAEAMAERIAATTAAGYPWLVWEEDGALRGYAYGRAYHARSAFRRTVECAIYLHPGATGRGMGRALYARLLDALRPGGYHVAIGAIALPNPASVRLHEQLGFEKAGHLAEVGWKFGQWIDVGYWQLRLDPPR